MMVRWKNGGCSAGLVMRRGDVRGGWTGRRGREGGRGSREREGGLQIIEGLFALLENCSDPKATVLLQY